MLARRFTLLCLMITLFAMGFAALIGQNSRAAHGGDCLFRNQASCRG